MSEPSNTQPAQAPEKRMSPADKVLASLNSEKMRAAIKAVMPKIMNYDRFMQMAVAAAKVQVNSKYILDKASIMLCVYNAAKWGLELNDSMGHAYLVPFKRTCTLIIGYKGLLELVRRSERVSDVHAFIVYSNDEFDYYVDEVGPHIKYRPTMKSDRGVPICGVSVARFTAANMAPSIDVMPYDRILQIKNAALARTPKSPWGNPMYEPEMAKKTVLRHHCKTLPMNAEASEVIDLDEKVERDEMPLLDMPEELKQEVGIDGSTEAEFTEVQEDGKGDGATEHALPPAEEQSQRTPKQTYNLMLAKLQKQVGSINMQELVAECHGKLIPQGVNLAELPDNDKIWLTLTDYFRGLVK
jgi:recombination protein RecT